MFPLLAVDEQLQKPTKLMSSHHPFSASAKVLPRAAMLASAVKEA